MELALKGKRINALVKKYRYVLLILVLGIVLMLLPEAEEKVVVPAETVQTAQVPNLTEELTEILTRIQGAGCIKILLTQAMGEEIVYQTDVRTSLDEGSRSEDCITVKNSNADRSESGLIRQVIPPKYQGAVVVCQGADLPAVRLAIMEPVADATGLSTDKISVLKMK